MTTYDPTHDLQEFINWYEGGRTGAQPTNLAGDDATDVRPEIVFLSYAEGGSARNKKIIKEFWNAIMNSSYDTLDGIWFVSEFNVSETNTPLFYSVYTSTPPEEVWDSLLEQDKVEIIFQVLKIKALNNTATQTINKNITTQEVYEKGFNLESSIPSSDFFVSKDVRGISVPLPIRKNINTLALRGRIDSAFFSGFAGLMLLYSKKNVADLIAGPGASGTPEGLSRAEGLAETVRTKNRERSSLSGRKIEQLLNDQGTKGDKIKALFKNLEQCFLLSAVPHFAKYRSDARVETLSESRVPYGGRIVPIDCDPIQNFMNYSSTTGDSYAFTRALSTSLINAIDFNFIVSNVRKEKIGGNLMEVEMPILFGDQKNILRENQTGSFKHVVLFKEGGNQNKSGSVDLSKILGSNQNLINQISYTDLKIDFIGENQATAKTNVDVSLTLQMPNLTYLQAEFDGETTIIKPDGKAVNHKYVYSPLDLITHLNRTNTSSTVSDISLKKYQGGASLFTPKFFKNYNRLVMKIVPVYNEKGLSPYDRQVLNLLKPYLDQNSLILDLGLIDHTITRGAKTGGGSMDELKMDYKGYIRSFLQDPICDVLRSKTQLESLIKAEETLINEIHSMKITPAANKMKVIQKIEKHNDLLNKSVKDHKKDFKINLFTLLKNNKQVWRATYKPSELLNFNITKDFEIKDASKVREVFIGVDPKITQDVDYDSITGGNLNETELNLDFIYFGDLVDALMNNMYEESRVLSPKDYEQMESNFKNFSMKVLLPSFNPIIYNREERALEASSNKINLADFPIAVSWLEEWINQEIVNTETVFYSLGPFMNNIISSLVNGILVDNCYRNGVASFLQFAVKSDFGTFGGRDFSKFNSRFKQENASWFNKLFRVSKDTTKPFPAFLKGGVLALNKSEAPFFRKDPRLPRSEHCNFLVVYQQIAVFSNYKKLIAKKNYFKDYGIPYFNLLSKTPNGSPNVLTKTMSFNKSTANYQRESRFQMEALYSLSQLASVYNVEVETSLLLLDVFPGMIIYADAGLYQDSTVIGSIANTLGMGGFHLNEKVTHTATISGNKLLAPRTTISANWIYAGADEEIEVEASSTTPSPPSTPSTPSVSTPAAGGAPGAQPGTLGLVPSIPGVPSVRETIETEPSASAENPLLG